MQRDLAALAEREYDLVVVGGGIFGACAAWDATLRGLSVALLERRDFAGATSANSFKIIHGGVRYLQHADVARLRESSAERRALLRIAPHLVRPLPIFIPTYGHGVKGKELLAAGLLVYDLLTLDRNRGIADPDRRIPRSRLLSRDEVLDRFPHLDGKDLTGGAVFQDGQMYNPPRLALAFLRSAAERGAQIANYVEATGFRRDRNRVTGVRARDGLGGEPLEVRGRVVLNAAGPWAEPLLGRGVGVGLAPRPTWSRDACFVVAGRRTGDLGLGVQGRTRDPDAILSREARHLFLVPWRDYTLVGVWHVVYTGDPDGFTVTDGDLRAFVDEVNWAYPPLDLTLDDVTTWNAGLVLFGENRPSQAHLSYGKRSRLVDHGDEGGVEGLVSLLGVRYTTARLEAGRAVDLALARLGRAAAPCRTAETPLHGGAIERFEEFSGAAATRYGPGLGAEVARSLAHNYGSAIGEVLRHVDGEPRLGRPLGGSHVIGAQVVHAVRDEMALRLSDVVYRRTDLATAAWPGEAAVRECARVMAAELGWSPERERSEVDAVRTEFHAVPHTAPHGRTPPS